MKKIILLSMAFTFLFLSSEYNPVLSSETPSSMLQEANTAVEEGFAFWSGDDTPHARVSFTKAAEYYENILNQNYVDKCVLQGLVLTNFYLGFIGSIDFIFYQSKLEPQSILDCSFIYEHVEELYDASPGERLNKDLTDAEIQWRSSLIKSGINSLVLLWARSDIYIQQGQEFSKNGAYFLSLKAYTKASQLLKRLNNLWLITPKKENLISAIALIDQIVDAQVSSEIGQIYLLIDDNLAARNSLEDARSSIDTAVSFAEQSTISMLISEAQGSKTYIDGLYYLVNGNYIDAEDAFRKCIFSSFIGPFNISFRALVLMAFATGSNGPPAPLYLNIGLALSSQGRDSEASKYLQLAISKYEEGVPVAISGDSLDEPKLPSPAFDESGYIIALNALGLSLLRLGQVDQAQGIFRNALLRANVSDIQIEQYKALLGLGKVSEQNGQVYEAIRLFKSAVDIYENIFDSLQIDIYQIRYQSTSLELYRHLITLLVKTGNSRDAFLYSEKARTLVFKNQFINELSRFNPQVSGLVKYWNDKRKEIVDLEAESDKIIPINTDARQQIAEIGSSIQTATKELNDLADRIALDTPLTLHTSSFNSLNLDSIQNSLPDNTTMIIYDLVDDDQVIVFVLGKHKLKAIFLEATYTEISSTIQTFRLDLTQTTPLHNLYHEVISTLINEIDTQSLVIVPYGILNYAPFNALMIDDQAFLGDKFDLSYSFNASAYTFTSSYSNVISGNHTPKALIFGNPSSSLASLPYAEQEAVDIGKMFDTPAFIGSDASKDRFLREATQADIIHLAAHGVINQLDPFSTYIALSSDENSDGKLEVRDIYLLNLKTYHPLVVLSACNTAQAELDIGDEFQTLSRAFIIAGASQVVGSLWLVDDSSSTTTLMSHFYQKYMHGMSAAKALAEAQSDIRRTPGWENPKYWAGFVLTSVK